MTRIAGFDDGEQDIAIDEIILNVAERKALTSRPVCLFSIHSLGRFFQRTGGTEHDLLAAMRPVIDAVTATEPIAGAGHRVDTGLGEWRRRVVSLHTSAGVAPTLLIRTWLSS